MRTRVDRGVYHVRRCACGYPKTAHQVYDVMVGTGRDPLTGVYRQKWERHHGTLTTARDARRELVGQARSGQLNRTTATLNDLFDRWLDAVDLKGRAPNTIKGYRKDAGYWRPALGGRPLQRIVRADVQHVLDALTARGLSPRTVHRVHRCISAAYTWAVKRDWLHASEDPTKKLDLPAITNRAPKVPTPQHVRAVLAEARAAGREDLERFVYLGAVMGCRSSELRALRLPDLDLDRGLAGIERALSAEVEWTTKNRQIRDVGLDEFTVDVVRTQIAYLEHRARTLDLALRPDAFLFCDDPTGREHWRESAVTAAVSTLFDHALRPEGVTCDHKQGVSCPNPGPLAHFTFKHLRKFMDTYAHELGYATTAVAARAGHDPSVAKRFYVGQVAETDRALSAGLSALLADPEVMDVDSPGTTDQG